MTHVLLFAPDTGIVVLTLSAVLIFVELNRPGMIFPGSLGVLGTLLVVNSWRPWQLSYTGLAFLLAALLVCLRQMRHASSLWWMLPCGLAFSIGFATLITGPAAPRVHPSLAAVCGCVLGVSASALARIAYRARENKGLD